MEGEIPLHVLFLPSLGIVLVLVFDAGRFFRQVSIVEFFTHTRWSPTILPIEFGVLPLISGTAIFTLCTALIALPVGLLAAVYLSEYTNEKLRAVLKPALEVLAGIPTVASISEDAIRAVPQSLRLAGYGLGITKFQVSTTIVIPSALSGIVSSFILGISRAIGETMAVTIAAGNLARMVNPLKLGEAFLQPVQTMTAAMVEIGTSDVTGDSVAYKSLFAVGLTLFLMTLVLNIISQFIKNRYREKYE